MFSDQQLKVIQYCATECEHQGSGEVSVYDMVNAWDAINRVYHDYPLGLNPKPRITVGFILALGQLVEPEDNKDGFRTIPIYINDPNYPAPRPIGSDWDQIERHLQMLLDSYYEGSLIPDDKAIDWETGKVVPTNSEDQFYYEYESIHPFRDGNGRTGKILYNYLCGSLENPIWPPNFFGGEHP